ncbi:MAG TPA: adenosylcobinamide-GDP ribazoletransferase [Mycobacteriales bacterium]|nr:adenosylcobinamide-GDP ribazoletransferase [Mycobacteriales bacterium]
MSEPAAAAPDPDVDLGRRAWDGFLLAVGLFTAYRVPVRRAGPDGMSAALAWAPAVGVVLGWLAAGVVALGRWLAPGAAGGLLTAAVTVAVLAWSTRGFHLDGLADTADGLGRLGAPEESLAVMRRSDIGPFGVTALVLVLLVEVAALARSMALGRGVPVVVLAVVVGRLAMVRAGTPGIPGARVDGLGAQVAGGIPRALAGFLLAVVTGGCAVPAALGHLALTVHLEVALAAGLLAAEVLLRRAIRRFGGVTGDVFGAVCEVGTAAALLAAAAR